MVLHTRRGVRLAHAIALAAGLPLLGLWLPTLSASADTYSVSAMVPFPAPTQAAVITQPANNTTVSSALQTISGTCQLLSPEGVVSIWRGSTALGSTICNGTFSVPVMLQEGTNVLVARSASASGLYGPDSTPLTITLNLPAVTQPGTSSPPTTPAQTIIASNAASASGLVATVSPPFATLSNNKSVSLTLTVHGGFAPYIITLNWGDGSVDTHTANGPGDTNFAHTYAADAAYVVHGQITDSRGASLQFSYAVVSSVVPTSGKHVSHGFPGVSGSSGRNLVWSGSIVGGITLLLLGDYWLGWHESAKHIATQAKKRRQKAAAAAKRRRKPKRKNAKR